MLADTVLPSAPARLIRGATTVLAFIAIALTLSVPVQAGDYLSYLAGNVREPRIGRDANGFIYIAGIANSSGFSFDDPIPHCPEPPCRDEIPTRFYDVVVMKLDPSTGEILYRTYLSGSRNEYAAVLAVSATGVVYLAGESNSTDLPVTPDAFSPYPTDTPSGPFLARIEPDGSIGYLSYLGDALGPWYFSAMAINSKGELVATGSTTVRLPATPGAVDVTGPDPDPYYTGNPFVTKLDPTGKKALVRAVGVGGSQLALGPDDTIFVAGSTSWAGNYRTTPGAFQTSFERSYCGSFFVAFPCARQYVSKLDEDATQIIYSTFVTGEHSELVGGITVDASGNAYVTGTTTSNEYPTTEGALQRDYRSKVAQDYRLIAHGNTAYVTKISPDGSSLLYSTYLGGVGRDSGYAIAVDAQGIATVAGETSSQDFPGGEFAHPRCKPNDRKEGEPVYGDGGFLASQAFVTSIAFDGSAVLNSRFVRGGGSRSTSLTLYDPNVVFTVGDSDRPDLTLTPGIRSAHPEPARTDTGIFLARVEVDRPRQEQDIDCTTNAATLGWVEGVPGGQILTLFGANTGIAEEHYLELDSEGRAPTTLGGARVLFDGVPGYLLYAGPLQINVQMPHFGSGESVVESEEATVRMDVEVGGKIIHSRILTRTARNPKVFAHLDEQPVVCTFSEITYSGSYPRGVILNEDGTLNSCENPAQRGSVLSFFFTGPGGEPSGVVEGAIHSQPLASLPADVKVTAGGRFPAEVTFAGGAEGHVSGVWRVSFRLPENTWGGVALSLEVDGAPAEPLEFSAWVRP